MLRIVHYHISSNSNITDKCYTLGGLDMDTWDIEEERRWQKTPTEDEKWSQNEGYDQDSDYECL